MRTVEQEQVASCELALPPSLQEALGELVNAAKDGLLALSVGVGLRVLAEMLEAEVTEVVGANGKRDPDRTAVRHGHEAGEVTLGGRRVGVERPRVRTADGEREVPLGTDAHFADRDPLTRVVLEQMLAGISTRRFARTREPVGQDVVDAERSTSKSAVSREFVGRTGEHLRALMARPLDDIRLAAFMLDGIELSEPQPESPRLKSALGVADLAHFGAGERPDHPHVEGDHEDRPPRVIRDEEEVGDRADAREHKRRRPCPRAAGEQAEGGYDEQDADQQVDPSPCRRVDVEGVVARDDVEVVVEDRRQPGDDLK